MEQLFTMWLQSFVENAPVVVVLGIGAWDLRGNLLQCIQDTRKLNERLLDAVLPDEHNT
jgi:hypothetical protein